MSIISFWLTKVCQPLDGFLWHKNITDPIIRPALRNQIFAAAFFLLIGSALYFAFPWLFRFGTGVCCSAWIFWSWIKLFLKMPLQEYGKALLKSVLLQFYIRFALFALLLYLAITTCDAEPFAIIAGMVVGVILIAICYFYYLKRSA